MKFDMRKFFIRLKRFIFPPRRFRPGKMARPYFFDQDKIIYYLPYTSLYEKIIESLRSRGWRIQLEIGRSGELEYAVYFVNSPLVVAGKK
jgi:hypothetical protein